MSNVKMRWDVNQGPKGLGMGRKRETESLKNASNASSLFKHRVCCSQLDLWRKRWISTHLSRNKVRWREGGSPWRWKAFFFPFPSSDGWFHPKVLSLPVKKISTVILINKCLDLVFATLMWKKRSLGFIVGCFYAQYSEGWDNPPVTLALRKGT